MPECKVWKNISNCNGLLIRTNWLPSSGEDPLLREYKCPDCGNITYQKTGRLQKVSGQSREKAEQVKLP